MRALEIAYFREPIMTDHSSHQWLKKAVLLSFRLNDGWR
jgi:hypothetical protein